MTNPNAALKSRITTLEKQLFEVRKSHIAFMKLLKKDMELTQKQMKTLSDKLEGMAEHEVGMLKDIEEETEQRKALRRELLEHMAKDKDNSHTGILRMEHEPQ